MEPPTPSGSWAGAWGMKWTSVVVLTHPPRTAGGGMEWLLYRYSAGDGDCEIVAIRVEGNECSWLPTHTWCYTTHRWDCITAVVLSHGEGEDHLVCQYSTAGILSVLQVHPNGRAIPLFTADVERGFTIVHPVQGAGRAALLFYNSESGCASLYAIGLQSVELLHSADLVAGFTTMACKQAKPRDRQSVVCFNVDSGAVAMAVVDLSEPSLVVEGREEDSRRTNKRRGGTMVTVTVARRTTHMWYVTRGDSRSSAATTQGGFTSSAFTTTSSDLHVANEHVMPLQKALQGSGMRWSVFCTLGGEDATYLACYSKEAGCMWVVAVAPVGQNQDYKLVVRADAQPQSALPLRARAPSRPPSVSRKIVGIEAPTPPPAPSGAVAPRSQYKDDLTQILQQLRQSGLNSSNSVGTEPPRYINLALRRVRDLDEAQLQRIEPPVARTPADRPQWVHVGRSTPIGPPPPSLVIGGKVLPVVDRVLASEQKRLTAEEQEKSLSRLMRKLDKDEFQRREIEKIEKKLAVFNPPKLTKELQEKSVKRMHDDQLQRTNATRKSLEDRYLAQPSPSRTVSLAKTVERLYVSGVERLAQSRERAEKMLVASTTTRKYTKEEQEAANERLYTSPRAARAEKIRMLREKLLADSPPKKRSEKEWLETVGRLSPSGRS